jgi:hypothetical protein
VDQVVEHLPSKWEGPEFKPQYHKKTKQNPPKQKKLLEKVSAILT